MVHRAFPEQAVACFTAFHSCPAAPATSPSHDRGTGEYVPDQPDRTADKWLVMAAVALRLSRKTDAEPAVPRPTLYASLREWHLDIVHVSAPTYLSRGMGCQQLWQRVLERHHFADVYESVPTPVQAHTPPNEASRSPGRLGLAGDRRGSQSLYCVLSCVLPACCSPTLMMKVVALGAGAM